MSFHIDRAYLNRMSGQLPLFKRIDQTLYKSRCIICGDSKKSKIKTRLYFYEFKGKMLVRCHNCGYSAKFSTFLQDHNAALYGEYSMEKFMAAKETYGTKTQDIKSSSTPIILKSWAENTLKRIVGLPNGHIARIYVEGRLIPLDRWNELYYCQDFKKYMDFIAPWHGKDLPNDERLVWFCTDLDGQLQQVCARALDPKSDKRYLKVRVHKEDTGKRRVFGLNNIIPNSSIIVVEGEIDSLFLPGCVASGDASLQNLAEMLDSKYPKAEIVIAWDNEPHNKEICKAMGRAIAAGHNVVIWPSTIIQKDINDMVKAGLDPMKIIKLNICNDLEAEFQFNCWKKC